MAASVKGKRSLGMSDPTNTLHRQGREQHVCACVSECWNVLTEPNEMSKVEGSTAQKHTHTHAHTHARTHTHAHTHTRTHACTHTHTYMNAILSPSETHKPSSSLSLSWSLPKLPLVSRTTAVVVISMPSLSSPSSYPKAENGATSVTPKQARSCTLAHPYRLPYTHTSTLTHTCPPSLDSYGNREGTA